MNETARPPHQWVAKKIDFSIAGVSLLRSGHRSPGFATMEKIEDTLGWALSDQVVHRSKGTWADEFESVLEVRYAQEQEQAD